MNRTRYALVYALLAIGIALTWQLIHLANDVKHRHLDLAELQDVRYGLLDAEVWVEEVSRIVGKRVDEFELTPENRPVFKKRIEAVLRRLLAEVESYLGGQRRRETSEVGRALRRLADRIREILIPFEQLQEGVPDYADAILEERSQPDAKEEIKRLLTAGIRAAADSTFSHTDRSRLAAIVQAHGCDDATTCTTVLRAGIEADLEIINRLMLAMVAVAVAGFAVGTARLQRLGSPAMFGLTGILLLLLAGGIATPMIAIEARISELSMQVLGEPLVFRNQVLYFQSKSVLDVVALLARTGELDMILVAALIGLFSVIFPAAKVSAGFAYFYDFRGAR